MPLDMSRGIPKGRPSRKMPAPFKRSRIEIGPKSPEDKRAWQWVSPAALAIDDVVADFGRVTEVREVIQAPVFESGLSAVEIVDQTTWRVLVTAGVPWSTTRYFDPTQQVWAFARRQD